MCQELQQMLFYQCFSNYLEERDQVFKFPTISDQNTFVGYNEAIIRKIKFGKKIHKEI